MIKIKYLYYCPYCNKPIQNSSSFYNHIKIHGLDKHEYKKKFLIEENLYKCKICGKRETPIDKVYCSNTCKHSDVELNQKRARKDKGDKTKQLKCKICNKIFYDSINASGALTRHLRNEHNISDKNFKEYYILEERETSPILECPYCDWNTIDIENKSGWFTQHLLKEHKVSISLFLEQYPEYNYLWKQYHYILERKKFLTDNIENYIECKICNQKLKYLTNSHLKLHNISQKEYKQKYGEIVSKNTQNKLSENYVLGLGNYSPSFQSKPEIEIKEYLQTLNIENIVIHSKSIINPFEIDIYLPDFNLAIEFNGLYWHSELNGKLKDYHITKTKLCEEKGIQLIHIFDDEWCNKKELIKNKLKYILKLNTNKERIYGRNTIIKEISSQEKDIFLEKYHIQGKDKSSIKLGAFFNNEIIAIMTFSKKRIIYGKKENSENDYELIRYAANENYIAIGTAGKLLNYFISKYKPNKIHSYADRRWSSTLNTTLYEKLGFKLIDKGTPNYWYLLNYSERKHRFNFTKYQIVNKYNGNKDLSEWENMINLGYDRIWDCGSLKYEVICNL